METVKKFRRQLKDFQIGKGDIETFCRLTPEVRKKLNLFDGDKAKESDVEYAVKAMPLVTCWGEAKTEGEETMTMSDNITIRFKIKWDQLSSMQYPGFIHSNRFPFLKKHIWHLIVAAQTPSGEHLILAE